MASDTVHDSAVHAGEAAAEPDTVLNAENPWPGLAAYDEASRNFFHGRSREARDLLRLIRLAPLTALYSKSGLGKSSLLQAGLFPLLREQHYLPVYLRIDFSDEALDPLEQAARRLDEELARFATHYPPRSEGEGLWAYLHRDPLEIWTSDNFPLVPVLVFDQFEEMFSRRSADSERFRQLRHDLADLIENRIPASFVSEAAGSERSRLDLLALNYRVVLSFREDYLPDLKSWEGDVPSLLRNYLRLEPMTRQCAIGAVEEAGRAVLADGVAPTIVDFVGRMNEETSEDREDIIEPVLLSLCCYQLNGRRKGGEKIDKALVEREARDILDDFYRKALGDRDVRGRPDVAGFIETQLVQGDRFRGSYPRAEAIRQGLLTRTQLEALTDRLRLLRVVQYADTARIELIHDRLVEVVCRVREERTARRALQRRRQYALLAIAAIGAVATYVFALNYMAWVKSRPWASFESALTGKSYWFAQDVANIGRPTPGFDLIYHVSLADCTVSRLHLMVFKNLHAIDMRSTNGSVVNGEYLVYGDTAQLKEGAVVVLAGVAAFRFHRLTYEPWQYFRPVTPAPEQAPAAWGLLIDGARQMIFPLTKEEVFVGAAGDDGVEPRDRAEGAIAIVRNRHLSGDVKLGDGVPVEVQGRRDRKLVRLPYFAPPGTEGETVSVKPQTVPTIEDVADGETLEVDIKFGEYSGHRALPEARQYYDMAPFVFWQGKRRFQVIRIDPDVEGPPHDCGSEQ